MTQPVALDTSVAVPLLATTHDLHDRARAWLGTRSAVLSGHAVVETFSVLTRLPGDVRQSPQSAAMLIEQRFGPPACLSVRTAKRLPGLFAAAGIAGASVYDALVALAAHDNGLVLATRDARAKQTYDALGVDVEVVS